MVSGAKRKTARYFTAANDSTLRQNEIDSSGLSKREATPPPLVDAENLSNEFKGRSAISEIVASE